MERYKARHSNTDGWYVYDRIRGETVEIAYGRYDALSRCRMLNREEKQVRQLQERENNDPRKSTKYR